MTVPSLTAAIDVGSNSVHLLAAHRDAASAVMPVLDAREHTGIGRLVDQLGRLGDEARARIGDLVVGYVEQARAVGADPVLLMGTEPLRRAADASVSIEAVRARTGLELVVLDRTQEGLLTLLGVTGGRIDAPLAVADIGGGSTEVTFVSPGRPPEVGVLPAGSARLAAAHIHHDPVTADEVAALRSTAREHAAHVPPWRPARGIIAGGSGTNVFRLLGRPPEVRVDRATIEEALALLRSHPTAELAARTGLTPGRVAQFAAGLALGEVLIDRLGLDTAEVSDASLREGALLAWWAAGPDWLVALPGLAKGSGPARPSDPAPDPLDRAS
jgi:exopolyphosphatase / guanosine-5'-triphosphate,3'-diphosphate pyrophosphatase